MEGGNDGTGGRVEGEKGERDGGIGRGREGSC